MSHARGQVWVDMLNSPNVLFCRPLIDELQQRDYPVAVTIRDFAQTRQLCELYGLPFDEIGRHGGATLLGKAGNLACRVTQLLDYARRTHPAAVLTHNSYSQLVVSRVLGIPSVTSMDYEYQPANHLAFRCADAVFVPRAFDGRELRRLGGSPRKVWRYPGIKEEIALAGFEANPGYRERSGLPTDGVLVLVRPPARFALYHRFDNPLFAQVLRHLAGSAEARVVVLPRTIDQSRELEQSGFGNLVWRGPVLDGPQAIAAADLVVSAGGSMVREAAALGTPAYSVYAGVLGGVDRELERQGRLTIVRQAQAIAAIRVEPKQAAMARAIGDDLVKQFVDHVEQAWDLNGARARWRGRRASNHHDRKALTEASGRRDSTSSARPPGER
jgi:predicted glycosyltransferase